MNVISDVPPSPLTRPSVGWGFKVVHWLMPWRAESESSGYVEVASLHEPVSSLTLVGTDNVDFVTPRLMLPVSHASRSTRLSTWLFWLFIGKTLLGTPIEIRKSLEAMCPYSLAPACRFIGTM